MENHIEVEETSSKNNKGFTLVELLIVIVILGILATVTVFAVRGITDKGKTSACTADQNTLQTALESYYAQNGNAIIPTEAQLVTAGLIRQQSTYLAITPSARAPATRDRRKGRALRFRRSGGEFPAATSTKGVRSPCVKSSIFG